jgi:hypothetical protein
MGLESGIRKNLFRILDPGSKRHRIPDPGSGSTTLKEYGIIIYWSDLHVELNGVHAQYLMAYV